MSAFVGKADIDQDERRSHPGIIFRSSTLSGKLFSEAVHAAATAKRVAHILVAHKTELAATLMAPFHDIGQSRITRSAARSHK